MNYRVVERTWFVGMLVMHSLHIYDADGLVAWYEQTCTLEAP